MGRTLIAKAVQTFDLPPTMLWPIIGPGWGAIKLWLPGVKTCALTPGDVRVGSVRTVVGKAGSHRVEVMTEYDPENYYEAFLIEEPNGTSLKGMYGYMKLEAKGDNATELSWWADAEEVDEEGLATATPYLNNLFEVSLAALRNLLMS